MMKMRVAAVVIAASFTGAAVADDVILSFGFTDLSGSFDQPSSAYTAVGVDTTSLKTAGHVHRHLTPVATASYDPGAAASLVEVSLQISGITGTSATGAGSIFIEDADGDRFVADITGTFSLSAPGVFFNGHLSNIAFVAAPGSNNMFNGPSGGSFPLTFAPAQEPLTGAIVQLHFDTAGTFFSQSFHGRATQVHGGVIPTPATAALLAMGGMVALRRRRR